jgi:hypothetical protein
MLRCKLLRLRVKYTRKMNSCSAQNIIRSHCKPVAKMPSERNVSVASRMERKIWCTCIFKILLENGQDFKT